MAAPARLHGKGSACFRDTRLTSGGVIYNSSIQPQGLASQFGKIYYLLVFSTVPPQDAAVQMCRQLSGASASSCFHLLEDDHAQLFQS